MPRPRAASISPKPGIHAFCARWSQPLELVGFETASSPVPRPAKSIAPGPRSVVLEFGISCAHEALAPYSLGMSRGPRSRHT
eukprot:4137802-Pyramimonas_sp.AAC.1